MAGLAGAVMPGGGRKGRRIGRRGITTALFAVTATALMGVVGLGTEAAGWYGDWVQLQGVADAAAMAGAVSVSVPAEMSSGGPKATATYVAQQNGVVSGSGGTTVTVNYPPASGNYKGNTYAVEVIISKVIPLHIGGLFLASGPTVTTRSVALYSSNKGTCMLSLGTSTSTSNNGQLNLDGGAMISASNCSIAANGTGANSVDVSPSPSVTAYTVSSAGGMNFNCYTGPPGCGTNFNLDKPYKANTVATADPLSSVQSTSFPTPSFGSSCTSISSTTTSIVPNTAGTPYCALGVGGRGQTTQLTASGGTYYVNGNINICMSGCNVPTSPAMTISSTSAGSTFYINGSINIAGSSTGVLNLAPGTYILYNGSLNVTASGGLTCTACVPGGAGVTIVLAGSSPGIVSVTGDSPVTFSAPATNNYNSALNGVAIYEVPSDTGTNTLGGSGSMTIQGAVYMPGALLDISGAAGTTSATCSVFVANTITMTGSGYATDQDCSTYGYAWAQTPTPSGVTLVE